MIKHKETKKISLNLDLFYRLGAAFVGIMLSITLTRNILIIQKANQKITDLKAEIAAIKQKNDKLIMQIDQAQTVEFQEKQARDKLGLVREGEAIVVLPDVETLKKFAPKTEEQVDELPDPNWKKWLKLFI